MPAHDFRFCREAFLQKHGRPDFCVMIINAHFPVQDAVTMSALAIGLRLRRKQIGKKYREAFPEYAEFPVSAPNVMKQRAPRQKRQIDFLHAPFER